jgi:hypothetical protein
VVGVRASFPSPPRASDGVAGALRAWLARACFTRHACQARFATAPVATAVAVGSHGFQSRPRSTGTAPVCRPGHGRRTRLRPRSADTAPAPGGPHAHARIPGAAHRKARSRFSRAQSDSSQSVCPGALAGDRAQVGALEELGECALPGRKLHSVQLAYRRHFGAPATVSGPRLVQLTRSRLRSAAPAPGAPRAHVRIPAAAHRKARLRFLRAQSGSSQSVCLGLLPVTARR